MSDMQNETGCSTCSCTSKMEAMETRIALLEAWVQEWEDAAAQYGNEIIEGLEGTLVPDQDMLDVLTRDKTKDN